MLLVGVKLTGGLHSSNASGIFPVVMVTEFKNGYTLVEQFWFNVEHHFLIVKVLNFKSLLLAKKSRPIFATNQNKN